MYSIYIYIFHKARRAICLRLPSPLQSCHIAGRVGSALIFTPKLIFAPRWAVPGRCFHLPRGGSEICLAAVTPLGVKPLAPARADATTGPLRLN